MNNDSRKVLFRKGIITNNPLLFEMIGVCPVVAIATSIKAAAVVALITALELIIIEAAACACLKNVKRYLRVLIYAVLGFLINFPLFYLMSRIMPEISDDIGIFLPLLSVSSVIALHCETFAVKNNQKDTFFDSLATSIGYAAVVLLVGAVREFSGSGTLFGFDIGLPYKSEAMLMPFGGFLALGFIAAFIKGIVGKNYNDEINSCGLDTSQIRALHISRLRQLIDENDDEDEPAAVTAQSFSVREKKNREKTVKKQKPERKVKKPKIISAQEKDAAVETKEEIKQPKATGYQPYADILASLDEYKSSKDIHTEDEAKEDSEE